MVTKTYVNKRDEDKYLLVRRYACGHTVVKQFIEWANGVRNYTGASLHGRSKKSHFSRWRKPQLTELLDDYLLVCEHEGSDAGHSLWELAAKDFYAQHGIEKEWKEEWLR
jgi:hypothetical protein